MIIAVDVGGTKTLTASFGSERHIANEERFPTPHDEEMFLKELSTTLERFPLKEAEAICVAIPGMLGADGTILRCGNLPWENFRLKDILAQKYSCPVFIENDANLAGLAETHSLPAIPLLSLYITISTGIGTGIITHGKLDSALSNSEAGHMVFETARGLQVWEDFASGQAIKEQFGRRAADIQDAADWQAIADKLATGLQALIPVLQPNVIIVGGSIGTYFERYSSLLTEALRRRLPAYIALPEFRRALHPQEAVLYGCYYYATHQNTPPATS